MRISILQEMHWGGVIKEIEAEFHENLDHLI